MNPARNPITASIALALALFAAPASVSAREMPVPGAPGGPDKGGKPHDLKHCVREVDRRVGGTAVDNVQYVTRYIKLKNFCGRSFTVTLDVAYQADPKCETLQAGESAELFYTVSTMQPPPQEYRRIKTC